MKTKLLLPAASFALAVGTAMMTGQWMAGDPHTAATVSTKSPAAVVLPTNAEPPADIVLPEVDAQVPVMQTSDELAAALASKNDAPSTQELLNMIQSTKDWPTRAALAKHLRMLSDPDTLHVLLPAMMETYGRGNTIFNEISDAIARMAQADTVEALEGMHWQASTQAGQGHKILRTVAMINNPPAKRALARLAQRTEAPGLAAAAEEALKRMAHSL
jgi:hypothetical protein